VRAFYFREETWKPQQVTGNLLLLTSLDACWLFESGIDEKLWAVMKIDAIWQIVALYPVQRRRHLFAHCSYIVAGVAALAREDYLTLSNRSTDS